MQGALAGYGQLPLSFEINQGQTDPQVNFLSRGSGYTLSLTSSGEAVLSLQKPVQPAASAAAGAADVLGMQLVGANPDPQVTGLDELPGKSNYLIGNDPSRWHTNVANYGRVAYAGVYPGINLVYYGQQRQLEYDFQVAAGADPGQIRLAFTGVTGIVVDGQGNLVLHTPGGDVVEHAPVLYQETEGVRQVVAGHYVAQGAGQVGFAVGAYDPSQVLVIDPVLSYSTYLGGDDEGVGIAVDAAGNAYVTGGGAGGALVAKLNAAGSALVYSTYLGGSGVEQGAGITVDADGNAYVTGYTSSTDFPTAHPLQPTYGGGTDAFVAKLNAAGSALLYSTYLGGSDFDWGRDIAVDAAGNAYVSGPTHSTDFPTAHPMQPAYGGGFSDAFVAKLNAAGSALVYSTYLGGSDYDVSGGIAVDAAGNAYVTGGTSSTNFPTANPLQPALDGNGDAFVAKLNAAGSALVYSTYLGGSGSNEAGGGDGTAASSGIAVDAAGNAYVTGNTDSTDFPTAHLLQPARGGGDDAFVAKLNAAGSALLYSTYLGGSGEDAAWSIAIGAAGNAYITGQTSSTSFPKAHSLQPAYGGGLVDAFVAELNAAGSALVYSTYLGGSDWDWGRGIAVDTAGNAYVTGQTYSTSFPTTANSLQQTFGGSSNGFIAKTGVTAAAAISMLSATTDGGMQLTVAYQITTSDLAAPFDLSFYRSDDALFDNADTLLDTVTVSSAADGTVGVHTKVFTIGGAAGQIALPGAGAAEMTGDYHLLAVVDPANAVDTASADKTAVLTGAYHLAGGGVFVQGGLDKDTLTLSVTGSTLSVILNGTTYAYAVSDTDLVHARTLAGDDTVNVLSTALSLPATIYLGSGNDTVNLGNGSNTINAIQGPLVFDGGAGTDLLNINDQGNTASRSFTVTSTSISRSATASKTYGNLEGITIHAGSGNDTTTIVSTLSTTPVTINGGNGLDTLVGPNVTNSWTISSGNGGKVGHVSFTGMENLTGGSGADTFKFSGTGNVTGALSGGGGADQLNFALLTDSGAGGRAITLNLQTGVATRADGLNLIGGTFSGIQSVGGSTAAANTLIGPNAFVTWNVTGANAGNIKRGLTVTSFLSSWKSFQKLIGGSDVDVFQFTAAGTETSVDGGTAPDHQGNWLDYVSVSVPVTVNLATGATRINGVANAAVANIQDVRGGQGGNTLTGNALGNILLGGTGNDTITGGSDRSLLIGDKGSDGITGKSGNDILIGDYTSYDTWTSANDNIDKLMAILAEWQSADTYATRFADLEGGGGLNWSAKLIYGTTIKDDASADTLTAMAGSLQNWFFQGPGDTLVHFLTGDHLNNS
jgi:hypothetical protein